MAELMVDDGVLTYKEAAEELGISADYVAHLVSRHVLHSFRLPGRKYKLLHRGEIEWWKRHRAGENLPNPYAPAEGEPEEVVYQRSRQPRPSVKVTPQDVEDLQEKAVAASKPVEATSTTSAASLLVIVLALLLAFILHQQPKQEQLEQLKTAPELSPVRRAVLDLARELVA